MEKDGGRESGGNGRETRQKLRVMVQNHKLWCTVVHILLAGLLWREQEAAVMYGSIDGGKTIGADLTFCELVS